MGRGENEAFARGQRGCQSSIERSSDRGRVIARRDGGRPDSSNNGISRCIPSVGSDWLPNRAANVADTQPIGKSVPECQRPLKCYAKEHIKERSRRQISR